MVLLISYDLNGKERPSAYEAIKKAIETKAVAQIRPLYSQWFVETNDDPAAWVQYLKGTNVIDGNDKLFVVPVTSPRQGLLTKAEWAWLKERVG
jgi:hypothetical protein